MNTAVIVTFILSLVVSLIMNNFFVRRPSKFLIKKANDSAVRFSSQTKPIFGGVSVFVIFMIIMIITYFLNNGQIEEFSNYISLFIIVVLSFFMGLADDTINTSPMFKFIVQIICAIVLIFNNIYIHISPHEWLNYLITVFWVVGIMNSINMLDNMDGVASLTTLSILGGVTIYSIMNHSLSLFELLVLVASCASLLGFLFYNWAPAKMYLGDNGSQIIGALLAYFGIIFFWNSVSIEEYNYGHNTMQFFIVVLAYIVPISDTTTVTINRLLKGKSPFVGGKDHTTHHLFYLGLSVRWVAFTLFIINTIGIILSLYLIAHKDSINYNYLWLMGIFPVITFLFLYLNTRFTKEK
ncbi:MAG: undecaprenyl/decaprenyl-phosphate alpha-N-acetylglucosaminyl 1-phosphate transferase [Bacteroidales bacterium]|jgi:UDP-GlcNAc:undecaprenyl-phosphate GlcNAc-1-phosphate transferase|nr:undecaprenyl/decaprenyl-phosphate alpha-N-acetylglucosaminyl 1-phosphate transferase [Bacteroidales bacterium]